MWRALVVLAASLAVCSAWTAFKQADPLIEIEYNIYCINNYEGRMVAIGNNPEGSKITFGTSAQVVIDATVINTPHQDHGGHGNWSGTDYAEAHIISPFHMPPYVALFPRKGAGKPLDWAATTGNPYIYFSGQNGWSCTPDGAENSDSCESVYGGNAHVHKNPPGCVFTGTGPWCMDNGPVSTHDVATDGPRRCRKHGDVFVGRCNQYLDDPTSPSFTVTCSTSSTASLHAWPGCRSDGHNILLGFGLEIRDHHRIIASQLSPTKFVTNQGGGPHEDFADDFCINAPAVGVLIDKSAGIKQSGDQDHCKVGDRRSNTTVARDPGDFTTCGVGGNPCIEDFECTIGGQDCWASNAIDLLDDDCSGTGKCTGGCRCSEIRRSLQRTIETDCHGYWGEEGEEHGEDGEDGPGEDGADGPGEDGADGPGEDGYDVYSHSNDPAAAEKPAIQTEWTEDWSKVPF